jgi:hypothetical protein
VALNIDVGNDRSHVGGGPGLLFALRRSCEWWEAPWLPLDSAGPKKGKTSDAKRKFARCQRYSIYL